MSAHRGRPEVFGARLEWRGDPETEVAGLNQRPSGCAADL